MFFVFWLFFLLKFYRYSVLQLFSEIYFHLHQHLFHLKIFAGFGPQREKFRRIGACATVSQSTISQSTVSFRFVSQSTISQSTVSFRFARNETKRNGTLRDGTLRNGTLRNGTLRNGTLRNGTLRNGTLRNGYASANAPKFFALATKP